MKKFSVVFAFFVGFLLIMSNNILAWKATEHQTLITQGISGAKATLTTNQKNIMITASKLADSDDKPASSTYPADGYLGGIIELHAAGETYAIVNNTKFLYEVAVEYRKGDANALNNVLARWDKKVAAGQISYFSREPMRKAVARITSSSMFKHFPEAAKADTPGYRSWKVLGLAHHLAGDVYAHRTIVPASAVSGTLGTYSSTTKVGKVHFNMTPKACTYSNGTTVPDSDIKGAMYVSSAMAQNYPAFNKLVVTDNNFACLKRAVTLGVVETRDIGRFDIHGFAANHFEDNKVFFETRFTLSARYASKRLMVNFMDKSATISTYTFAQYEGQEATKTPTYQVNGLKEAYRYAGYDVDSLGWNWSVLSNNVKV